MADSKITALTSIGTSTDPAVDPLVLVDVSDTSMAATGTTKKVTLNNLLSSSPTATGNFTITGDLTVDTSTLKVDSANNRVGIGTASPGETLDLTNTSDTGDRAVNIRNSSVRFVVGVEGASGNRFIGSATGNAYAGTTSASGIEFATNNNVRALLDSSGNLSIANGNLVMSTSGKGIDFSATANSGGTMTSELLNDYEEGTWTIVVNDQLGNSATVASQVARYVKVGRRVFVYGDFTLSSKGAASAGNLVYLGNLPFVPVTTAYEGSVVHRYDNTSLTTNGQINIISAAGGNNVCFFTVSSATTGTSNLTFAQITNTTRMVFNFSYDV